MKELYEFGIVFRGFVLVNHIFKEIPDKEDSRINEDLRGAFIDAINTFAKNAFNNLSLEYLESNSTLFIFKVAEVRTSDCNDIEPIILYGLTEKKKKDSTKIVKKFLEKVEPILQLFVTRYNDKDFSELTQFEPFKEEIIEFFV
ncbi:MAG: hypothetical protein ACFE85_14950 [Candidatus Hodarchaeota archaeon]